MTNKHISRKVTEVSPVPGALQLDIVWNDGVSARVDVSHVADTNEETARLRDPDFFVKVAVIDWGWAVGWPGDIDLGADNLREWAEAQAKTLPVMTCEEFRAWLKRHGLILDTAAEVLDINRRTLADYSSGKREIPRVVGLACRAIDAGLDRSSAA